MSVNTSNSPTQTSEETLKLQMLLMRKGDISCVELGEFMWPEESRRARAKRAGDLLRRSIRHDIVRVVTPIIAGQGLKYGSPTRFCLKTTKPHPRMHK